MASSTAFDTYGFLNAHWPLNHTNWAAYFNPSIPDGVIAGIDDEMEAYANSSGMRVYIKTGECRCRSHRGQITEIKALDIAAADRNYDRIDAIVARVTYSNAKMVLAVKTGTPSANPSTPGRTRVAGSTWEIYIAAVRVHANATTIAAEDVTDRRDLYQIETAKLKTPGNVSTFSAVDHTEHRLSGTRGALTIDLPDDPAPLFCCTVSFSSGSGFSGITFRKGGAAYTPKRVGDLLTYSSKRYDLSIWWDGAYYRVSAQAA